MTSDLDALIERCVNHWTECALYANPPAGICDCHVSMYGAEAAGALVQLRDEISARSDLMQAYLDCWRKAEAEVVRLKTQISTGVPMSCPDCKDAYIWNENDQTWHVPKCSALVRAEARIAALEAELAEWKQELLESSDPRYWYHKRKEALAQVAALEAEREALAILKADAVAIFEWLNRKGGLGLDVHRRIDTFLATWAKP